MKKTLFLTLALCIMAGVTLSAQESTFLKKDNVVSVGVGFGGNLYAWTAGSGIKKMPVFSLTYDYCLMDNLFDEKSSLGIGGIVAYTQAKWDGAGWGWKTSNIVIGARGTFHYALVNNLDTYAGMMLGYNIFNHKWTGSGYSQGYKVGNSGFAYSFFAGARYYFTDAIAAVGELGYGYAIINVGVSFKF
jgi:hypothetical protein